MCYFEDVTRYVDLSCLGVTELTPKRRGNMRKYMRLISSFGLKELRLHIDLAEFHYTAAQLEK